MLTTTTCSKPKIIAVENRFRKAAVLFIAGWLICFATVYAQPANSDKGAENSQTGSASATESCQNYEIKKDVIDAAGGTGNSTNFVLETVLGQQTPPGFSSGTTFNLFAGFLTPVFLNTVSVDEPVPEVVPEHYGLGQNYPNPFNPTTIIRYQLSVTSVVELTIYNPLGQKIKTLVSQVQPAGEHQIPWNGTNDLGRPVVSGVYFYRLQASATSPGERTHFVQTRKLLLIR